MPTTTTAAAFAPSFILRPPQSAVSIATPSPSVALVRTAIRRRFSCQVALSTDVSSSSSEVEEEKQQAAAKIGKRVRVKVPLKVCHVQKAPELDLNGLEGVIKQYVGVWKGKKISANLPFKVEFQIDVEGQPRPVKFLAHLREDEFEYLTFSD